MAFKKFDEKVIFSHELNSRGDHLNITDLRAPDGDYRIDIRQMYTGDDGELHHTSKGVRFSREILIDVMTSLIDTMDEDEIEAITSYIDEMKNS